MATPTNPITSAGEWKAKATQGAPLKVPSGNVCLARNPGMQAFMQAGMIPNPLLAPVQKALASGKGDVGLQELISDNPERMNAMLQLIDNAVMYCVLEPAIYDSHQEVEIPSMGGTPATKIREPIPRDKRDPDALYIDEVDPEDKVFIFQWACGGSSDLVKFRRELGSSLEALSSGKNPAGKTTKRAPRATPTKRTNASRPRKAAAARKRRS